MFNKNAYEWSYQIMDKDGNLYADIWVTNWSATRICAFFELRGYEILYLNRVREVPDYATHIFSDVIKDMAKVYFKAE